MGKKTNPRVCKCLLCVCSQAWLVWLGVSQVPTHTLTTSAATSARLSGCTNDAPAMLNPNQHTHSSITPVAASTALCGRYGLCGRSKRPIRGPTMQAPCNTNRQQKQKQGRQYTTARAHQTARCLLAHHKADNTTSEVDNTAASEINDAILANLAQPTIVPHLRQGGERKQRVRVWAGGECAPQPKGVSQCVPSWRPTSRHPTMKGRTKNKKT